MDASNTRNKRRAIPPAGLACAIAFFALSMAMGYGGGADVCHMFQQTLTPAACEKWRAQTNSGQRSYFCRHAGEIRTEALIVNTKQQDLTLIHEGVMGHSWNGGWTGGRAECDMRITIGNRHDSKGNVLSDADFVELVNTTNAKMGYTKKLFSIPVYEPIEPSTL